MARLISRDLRGRDVTLVIVLDGAFIFAADLARRLAIPVRFAFVSVSSYGERRASAGSVRWRLKPGPELKGRDVVIVEDIVDTGRSLREILRAVRELRPRSVRTCALLRKPGAPRDLAIDHLGFEIPDAFVVGYGLDLGGRWREQRAVLALDF